MRGERGDGGTKGDQPHAVENDSGIAKMSDDDVMPMMWNLKTILHQDLVPHNSRLARLYSMPIKCRCPDNYDVQTRETFQGDNGNITGGGGDGG